MPSLNEASAVSREHWEDVSPPTQRHWAIRWTASIAILLLVPPFLVLMLLVNVITRVAMWGGSKD